MGRTRQTPKQLAERLPPYGRWVVVAGAIVGVAFVLRQHFAADEDLYVAFMKGIGAAIAVLVALAIAQPLWKGREATKAQGPGGTGLEFPDPAPAGATQEAFDELNNRVTRQMMDVNKRLYDLEKAVFKRG